MTENSIAQIISPLLNRNIDEVEEWIRAVYVRIVESILLKGKVYLNNLGTITKQYVSSQPVQVSSSHINLNPPKFKVSFSRLNNENQKNYDIFYDISVSEFFLAKNTAQRFSYAFHRVIQKSLEKKSEFVLGKIGRFTKYPDDQISFIASPWLETLANTFLNEFNEIKIESSENAAEEARSDDEANLKDQDSLTEENYVSSSKSIESEESYEEEMDQKSDTGTYESSFESSDIGSYYTSPRYNSESEEEEEEEESSVLWKKIAFGATIFFVLIGLSIGTFLFLDANNYFSKQEVTKSEKTKKTEKKVKTDTTKDLSKFKKATANKSKKSSRKLGKQNKVYRKKTKKKLSTQEPISPPKPENEDLKFTYAGSYWTIVLYTNLKRQKVDEQLKIKQKNIPTPYNKELYVILRNYKAQQVASLCLGGFKKEADAKKLMDGILEKKLSDKSETFLYFLK